MSTAGRRRERPPGRLERGARRLVGLTGLDGHAEALGVARRAAAVDRWCARAADSPPVGSPRWLVVATCFVVLSGVGVEVATLVLAAAAVPDPVEVGALSWQPLLGVWVFGPPACTVGFLWWLRRDGFGRPASLSLAVDAPLSVALGAAIFTIGLPVERVTVVVLGATVGVYWPSLAGIVGGTAATAAWLGLRATPADGDVSPVEVVALATLSALVVVAVHLLTTLPDAFI